MVKSLLSLLLPLLLTTATHAQAGEHPKSWDAIFSNLTEANDILQDLLGENCSISDSGFVVLSFWTDGEGRISFPIQDVEIFSEEAPEEPGCGGICPPRLYIEFECLLALGDCIQIPQSDMRNDYDIISVFGLEKGYQVKELLEGVQEYLGER